MTFSFVIPAKNEESRIGKCLKAIHAAAAPRVYEIIVVDNGSTDGTRDAALRAGAKVLFLPHATIAAARNFGAGEASGDVLIFVDADCEVGLSYLDSVERQFLDGGVGMLTGNIEIPRFSSWVTRTWYLNRFYGPEPFRVSWASSMNMFIRRESFLLLQGFDESMQTCEDVELCKRLAKLGLSITHDPSCSVVHHGEAATLTGFFRKERWRGKSLLKYTLTKADTAGDALLLLSFYLFLSAEILLATALLVRSPKLFMISLFVLLGIPVLRALKIICRRRSFSKALQLVTVWSVYYVARSVAITDGMRALLISPKQVPGIGLTNTRDRS